MPWFEASVDREPARIALSMPSGKLVSGPTRLRRRPEKGSRIQREVHKVLKDRAGIYLATIQTEVECSDPAEEAEGPHSTRGQRREAGEACESRAVPGWPQEAVV